MMSNHSRSNWADLPLEILELIGKRLETRMEVYRFRAICSSWRSAVPLSTNISSISPPLRLPPPFIATALLSPVFFYRLEDETRTASCLIKVTQSASGDMKILDPLSSHYTLRKNSLASSKSINILGLRFVQLFKGYRLTYMHTPSFDIVFKRFVLFGNSGFFMINHAGELGFFGFDDQIWVNLGNEGIKYDDVVVYKGQYYVADALGTVYWIDTSKSMSLVQFSPQLFGLGQLKNLVVSDGELYVVDSYYDDGQSQRLLEDFGRVDIKIYRLDQDWGTWVDVNSLGDRVFLLAKETCLSVSTKDIPGCNSNCVYFSDPKMQDRHLTTELKRYFGRVFDIGDRRRMKMIDCYPCHQTLFDLRINFPCTLSPPEYPVSFV